MKRAICRVVVGLVAFAALVPLGFAAEGPAYGGPVGGSDIENAYLPAETGFYGAVVGGYANGSQYYDNNHHRSSTISAANSSGVAAVGALYIYPFKLFGGTLGTSVQGSLATGHIELNNRSDTYDGTGDIYSDLLVWSRYLGNSTGSAPTGLTVKLAYSMIFPTGHYDQNAIVSTGRNTIYYIPNAAFSYLTGPNVFGDGTEFSLHVFLDIAATNSATKYHNGPVIDFDYAISEKLGLWQFGLAGYYATQLSDDHQNGQAVPGGNRFASAGIGPVLSYTIPQWKSNIKLKASIPIYTRNSLAQNVVYLIFSKAFN
ncbi:transporter [Paraburkholderia sp. C35]|uniref:SphA family protein n=1 Tax=Paraburkholderia sp. C35 TaxID=2126993 RepID=UPI000D68E66A|nr:transporter [Paraburkholderia sp. C35]